MKIILISIAAMAICISPSIASAGNNSQVFPPENADQCSNSNIFLTWEGQGNPVRCSRPPAVPSGAVMAFALNACPDGWEPFAPAQGRVIVGHGSEASGDVLSTGGSDTVQLHTRNMPRHSHPIRLTTSPDNYELSNLWTYDKARKGLVEWDATDGFGNLSVLSLNPEDPRHSLIAANGDGLGPYSSAGYTGGDPALGPDVGVPFDARMPYVTLLYCVYSGAIAR